MMRLWIFLVGCLSMLLFAHCGFGSAFPDIKVAYTETESRQCTSCVFASRDQLTYQYQDKHLTAKLVRYRQAKIYNEMGKSVADIRLPFDDVYRIQEIEARVIMPLDGGKQRVVSYSAKNMRLLAHITHQDLGSRHAGEMQFHLNEAKEGAVIDYVVVYQIDEPALLKPIVMREHFAVDLAEVDIIYPKRINVDTAYVVQGLKQKANPLAILDLSQDMVGYRYVEHDLPPFIAEEMRPSVYQIGPSIWPVMRESKGLADAFLTWSNVGTFLMKYYQLPQAPLAMSDNFDRIQKLWNDTRHSSTLAAAEKETNRLDKGIQLYQKMRQQGLPVQLGLVARETQSLLLEEHPTPALFDAALVVAQHDDKRILDPSCQYCLPGTVSPELEDAQVLIIGAEESRVTTIPERPSREHIVGQYCHEYRSTRRTFWIRHGDCCWCAVLRVTCARMLFSTSGFDWSFRV